MPNNGRPIPTVEQLFGISQLARALGSGSDKLRIAIVLVYGDQDPRHWRAWEIDAQLPTLGRDLDHGPHQPSGEGESSHVTLDDLISVLREEARRAAPSRFRWLGLPLLCRRPPDSRGHGSPTG